MKLTHIWLVLLFLVPLYCTADSKYPSEENFTEFTADSIKFKAYLNKIYDNNYFNNPVVVEYIEKCQKLLDNKADISNNNLLDFELAKITYEQNDNKYIKSYQMLKDAKYLLNSPDISKFLRNEFIYIEGFTLMTLGDYESAQETYYKLLEEGKKTNEKILVSQAIFSLGQLYLIKKDYARAQEYYLQYYQMKVDAGGFKGYDFQIYPEIIDAYIKMKDFDNAEKYNNEVLAMIDTTLLADLKPTLLLFKVEIELERSNITEAKKAYKEAFTIASKTKDQLQLDFCKSQKASILEKEGQYKEALAIYEDFIEHEELFHFKLEWSKRAHEVSAKMKNFEKAYEFSLLKASITDSIQNEKKMQQTELLAIKFEAEQKQKTNDSLKAEMLKKQTHQNRLYAIMGIFAMGILGLIIAFFQKMRYSDRLKIEVANRTKELSKANHLLSQSNQEMEEFNRILSHDLKEPLRSIISFSSLAENSLGPESNASEYLGFISKSGRQLNQLIEDVSKFQAAGDFSNTPPEQIESALIIDSISRSIESLRIKKNVLIQHSGLPKVNTQKSFLFLVFKNLIENGIKYNQSEQPIIQIRHREDGNFHYFEIEDNGIGIDQNFHDKVFGMFQRLNNRDSYEGTGLGLAMARKMMKKMNGDVKVLRSEEGKGSVFEVSLPKVNEEETSYKMVMSEAN